MLQSLIMYNYYYLSSINKSSSVLIMKGIKSDYVYHEIVNTDYQFT